MSLPSHILNCLIARGFVNLQQPIKVQPQQQQPPHTIWLLRQGETYLCVKQSQASSKVKYSSLLEGLWFRHIHAFACELTPRLLGHDIAAGILVFELLPSQQYLPWQQSLDQGHINLEFCQQLGTQLARVHQHCSHSGELKQQFSSALSSNYFVDLGLQFPDLTNWLSDLSKTCNDQQVSLLHGDLQVKNILQKSTSPIFIDASSAHYGDPAIDLATLLSNFFLNCYQHPELKAKFIEASEELLNHYLAQVKWEDQRALEQRCCNLLPAFLLQQLTQLSPRLHNQYGGATALAVELCQVTVQTNNINLSFLNQHWQQLIQ